MLILVVEGMELDVDDIVKGIIILNLMGLLILVFKLVILVDRKVKEVYFRIYVGERDVSIIINCNCLILLCVSFDVS